MESAARSPESSSAWTWAGVAPPAARSFGGAIAVHAGLYLRRLATWRALWPYLLVTVAVVAGALGLTRLSLADPSALVEYFGKFVLRAEALIALGLGTAAVRADADSGVLGYYLLRPRAVVALPVGRYLALVAVVAALGIAMAAGVLASAAGTVLLPSPGHALRMCAAVVLAAISYGALFLLLGAWVRPAAATGLGWLVAVDLALASVSDAAAQLSPSHHLAALAAQAPGNGGLPAAELTSACAALLALAVAALGATLWRMRGHAPT